MGCPEKLKVQVVMIPKKKPYLTEMGKMLRWLKKIGGHAYIKVEWGPLCSVARVQSTVEVVATFRTSTVWKIEKSSSESDPGNSGIS